MTNNLLENNDNYKNQLIEARKSIHEIDLKIIQLLGERDRHVKLVGSIKKIYNLPVLNEIVAKEKQLSLVKLGKSFGLNGKFIRKIWRNIHDYSVKTQIDLMGDVHVLQKINEKKEKLELKMALKNKKLKKDSNKK